MAWSVLAWVGRVIGAALGLVGILLGMLLLTVFLLIVAAFVFVWWASHGLPAPPP